MVEKRILLVVIESEPLSQSVHRSLFIEVDGIPIGFSMKAFERQTILAAAKLRPGIGWKIRNSKVRALHS